MAGEQPEDALLEEEKGERDLEEIKSLYQFVKEVVKEKKKLWYLAGPAIFTSLAQYSLGATTQVFASQLTTLELDAVSTENMIIACLAFGIMLGMGSAPETLCGQAFGAKQLHILGVYMQRSWVILTATCVCLLPIYLFATPILRFLNQDDDISLLAGRLSLYIDGAGFTVPLPEGYRGYVLEKKSAKGKGLEASEGAEEFSRWVSRAEFRNLTTWNHDSVPSSDDRLLRCFHWFSVADAAHQWLRSVSRRRGGNGDLKVSWSHLGVSKQRAQASHHLITGFSSPREGQQSPKRIIMDEGEIRRGHHHRKPRHRCVAGG